MKVSLWICSVVFLVSSQAWGDFGAMRRLATSKTDSISKSLKKCKLTTKAGNSANIESWLLSPNGLKPLARYDEQAGIKEVHVTFTNPNGGMQYRISYGDNHIKFVNPLKGTVARIRYQKNSKNGRYPVFRCFSKLVGEAQFNACVDDHFTNIIVSQLCRFGA